jgi:hypothetical protein
VPGLDIGLRDVATRVRRFLPTRDLGVDVWPSFGGNDVKTRERSAAGGRAAMSAPTAGMHAGERLPVAPRERKPALAALAVLLILVGALGATVLVMRAGNRVAAIMVTKPVAAGAAITQGDITEVMVANDPSVLYVKWSQRGALANYQAQVDLVKGTVLVGAMLGGKTSGLKSGQAVVGLSLTAGQFPSGLKVGDTVAAYWVGTDAAKSSSGLSSGSSGSGGTLLAPKATVKSVPGTSSEVVGSTNSQFSVVVSQSYVDKLSQAASAGAVALVLIPGSTN